MTYSVGGNEIDCCADRKRSLKYWKDVKLIPGELQHGLVVADVDRKKLSGRVMRNKVLTKKAVEIER